jgi:hypothetical protein
VSDERVAKIEKLLTEAFQPSDLLVKDQSHLHAGHAGAQDGRGHFWKLTFMRCVSTRVRQTLPRPPRNNYSYIMRKLRNEESI